MKYVLLKDNIAQEIIPECDPVFPGVPIEKRYSADFIAQLMPVEDNIAVEQNWVYDPDGKTFAPPEENASDDIEEEPYEEPPREPSIDERLAAVESAMLAMMMGGNELV